MDTSEFSAGIGVWKLLSYLHVLRKDTFELPTGSVMCILLNILPLVLCGYFCVTCSNYNVDTCELSEDSTM